MVFNIFSIVYFFCFLNINNVIFNIVMLIVKLKKDINKQKKVLEAYQKSFDEEGKPLDASVDPAKIKDLSIDTKNAVSDTAEKLKGELLTEAPTNESIHALIGAVTKG